MPKPVYAKSHNPVLCAGGYNSDLKIASGFWYLASPYSLYPGGTEAAFRKVSIVAGRLMRMGIPVFCPIAHSHPIAEFAGIPPTDHDFWISADRPMMAAAHGIIVAKMRGWDVSLGVEAEIDIFNYAGKPVHFIDPETI